jgi:hypothetical protein
MFSDHVAVSRAPEASEDGTVMDKHGANVLDSKVNRVIHAIRTENNEAQQIVLATILGYPAAVGV